MSPTNGGEFLLSSCHKLSFEPSMTCVRYLFCYFMKGLCRIMKIRYLQAVLFFGSSVSLRVNIKFVPKIVQSTVTVI